MDEFRLLNLRVSGVRILILLGNDFFLGNNLYFSSSSPFSFLLFLKQFQNDLQPPLFLRVLLRLPPLYNLIVLLFLHENFPRL